jgi:hypothetical protein
MSVRKDDKIFIEAKPEYEGWLVAKGRGRTGLVPESYVQLVPPLVAPSEQGLFIISSSVLSSLFKGLVKNSGVKVKKSKSILKKKNKSTTDTTIISSSPTVVYNEADYFSDD